MLTVCAVGLLEVLAATSVFGQSITAVIAWGRNDYGQTKVPQGLTNVVGISAGYMHGLALKNSGTVVAWGANDFLQTNVPLNLTSVVAVAASGQHSLALKADGTVVGWGDDYYGQAHAPSGLSNVIAIAAGAYHSLALSSNGLVFAWGAGTNNSGLEQQAYGQCMVPEGLSNVVAVAAGDWHSLALKADGTVVAWGRNSVGQVDVPLGLSNVVAIAGGGHHSLALKADGQVVGWGHDWYGQANPPSGLTNAVAIAAGYYHSLALKADGQMVAWGAGTVNSSQYPDYGQSIIPKGLSNVMAIAGMGDASLALVKVFPPTITTQPMSRTNAIGSKASFTATAAGTAPLSYQWRKNGLILANGAKISGATSPTLNLNNVQSSDAGDYLLVVTNLGGRATSVVARLTVVDMTLDFSTAKLWNLTNGSILSTPTFTVLGSSISTNVRISAVRYNLNNALTWTTLLVSNNQLDFQIPLQPSPGPNLLRVVLYDDSGQHSLTNTVAFTGDLVNGAPDTNKFVWIAPGTFVMGSPLTEPGRRQDEPQHQVTISQGFYMSKYETTQAEYLAVIGNNPSAFADDPQRPVECVTWSDATNYCGRLTRQEQNAGRLLSAYQFRLPTEAEWEYACRAGTTTATAFGNSLSSTQANFDGDRPYNGAALGPCLWKTTPVGSFAPNAWGLYDMHGNVAEWCSDWYATNLEGMVTDPQGPFVGELRVCCGGGYNRSGAECRSASHSAHYLSGIGSALGFRTVAHLVDRSGLAPFWYLPPAAVSRTNALALANSQEKMILLAVLNTNASQACEFLEYGVLPMASPPIRPLLQESFVFWRCGAEQNQCLDYTLYTGANTLPLPALCLIDPRHPETCLDARWGDTDPLRLYDWLSAWLLTTTRPTIAYPHPNQTISVGADIASGSSASTNVFLATISYQLNDGPWRSAPVPDGLNWQVPLQPSPGPNVLNLVAYDAAGRHSLTNTVAFTYDPVKWSPDTNRFAWIPPGSFVMGSPVTEPGRRAEFESPQHQVTLTHGFYLSKYETTQAEYQAVMGNNPSWFVGDLQLPVEQVTWFEATNYCYRLTQQERAAGRLPPGCEYRLPTEAEWEYACRAGTTTATAFGNSLSSTQANFDGACGTYPYNGAAFGPFLRTTTRGGRYDPNAWGLFDMHGNVWEWCLDWLDF